jgi:hypothetical protein
MDTPYVEQPEPLVLNSMPLEDHHRPVRSTDACTVEEAEEDGTFLLFQTSNESLFLMKGTAKAILDLCSGQRTVSDIVKILNDQYAVPDGIDVRAAVVKYLTVLLKLNLVSIA